MVESEKKIKDSNGMFAHPGHTFLLVLFCEYFLAETKTETFGKKRQKHLHEPRTLLTQLKLPLDPKTMNNAGFTPPTYGL